jgi:hypothetical protein
MDREKRLCCAVRARVDLFWWRVGTVLRLAPSRPILVSNSLFVHRDGHYGLYLDETLYEGSSAHCPTFNNDPLCTSDPSPGDGGSNCGTATFECVGLEVWGVGLLS